MAHWSLESIFQQTFSSYEVFILEKEPSETIHKIAEKRKNKVTFLSYPREAHLADLLNGAIDKVQGEYIHILQPGDFYLSKRGLEYVKGEIEKKPHCDLIYGSFLLRDEKRPPTVISYPMSSEFLQKGKVPTRLQCCWFSKKIFSKVGQFNPRFEKRPGLDFLCRVFLNKDCRFSAFRRVVVDYEPIKASSFQVMGYAFETFRLIFHYFGLTKAISWWFTQEHSGFFQWGKNKIRRIFFRP